MYGVVSYVIYYVLFGKTPLLFTEAILDLREKIKFREIIFASFIAAGLGIVISININRSFTMRLMRYLRITNRYSDADVWSFTMNSPLDAWITVRDRRRGLVYDGYIDAFSPGDAERELLLSRVVVYDAESGDEVDKIPVLYLSLEKNDIALEFRNVKFEDWMPDTEYKGK